MVQDTFGDFLIVDKKTNKQFDPINKCCMCSQSLISVCAVDSFWCPKTIKRISISHIVALGNMLLHHHEHGHCNLF